MKSYLIRSHTGWHVAGILLVIALIIINHKAKRAHILLYALFRWPGTALHESAHLITGWLLGAKPIGYRLIPRQEGDSPYWRLGSVTFKGGITAWNAVPIGLAPLSLLFVAWLCWTHWFSWFHKTLVMVLCLYGILFYLCSSIIPSSQDLRIALNWRSVILYVAITAVIIHVFH
jgi:hypothetical protein